jgi:hypothetical protein
LSGIRTIVCPILSYSAKRGGKKYWKKIDESVTPQLSPSFYSCIC